MDTAVPGRIPARASVLHELWLQSGLTEQKVCQDYEKLGGFSLNTRDFRKFRRGERPFGELALRRLLRVFSNGDKAFDEGEAVQKFNRDVDARIELGAFTPTEWATLRQMLLPDSLNESRAPLVIAANPLSWRAASRKDGGWPKVATYSDYVGIRGLINRFGGLKVPNLPELVCPEDLTDKVFEDPMTVYSIGSPKTNRWTGRLMEEFFEKNSKSGVWDFRPDPESRRIWNPGVILRHRGKLYEPADFEDIPNRTERDFGIVLRGPHPRDPSAMFMVLAGRAALGTEAASYAVTELSCLNKLVDRIRTKPGKKVNLDDHSQAFLAIVSIDCDTKDGARKTDLDTFEALAVYSCE